MSPEGIAGTSTALVVGVTSHRDLEPTQLPALRARLVEVLTGLRVEYPALSLAVLSPLAEGGDQLVAEVGLELGARLVVPLPLPAEMYAEDFLSPGSRARFHQLLAHAEVIPLAMPAIEPHALRTPGPLRDWQYLQAGLYVANHCHVLLALWDGRSDGGTGGTAQIVRYYLGGPLPGARRASDNLRQMLAGDDDSLVLHLPVRRGILRSDQDDAAASLGEQVADQRNERNVDRERPDTNLTDKHRADRDQPLGEPVWLTSSGQQTLAAGIPRQYRCIFERMQTFEYDRRQRAAANKTPSPQDPAERALHEVDAMAVHFQRRSNGAIRAIHGLAFLMGVAFLMYADLGAPDLMLWVFLLFFAVGMGIAIAAHRRDWHRKHIDYRALAEGLRVQAFWRRAGLTMAGDPEFAHDNFMQKQDVELGWIRNVMRQIGLMGSPPIQDSAAQAVDAVIEAWVGRPGQSGQLAYYECMAGLREHLHLRAQALGKVCLWAGIGISLFLALFHSELEEITRNVLVTAMGMLSLIAAVREAYAYRKADKELVKQYRFMHRIYRNARIALDAAASPQEQREILFALGEAALDEHAEWALMHRDRPIQHVRA